MKLSAGIIGCGNISSIYLENLPKFADVKVVACADLREDVAARQAEAFGITAAGVNEILQRPDIGIIVNLTVPSAHAEVTLRALAAGKHVYSEKPLAVTSSDAATIVADASRRGLNVGVAPDTVLGAGLRRSRDLIDSGKLGRIVTGTATIFSHGMEHWHPDPEFFFKPGAGPVFDMGPYYIAALVQLLGPVKRLAALTSIGAETRTVTAKSPKRGTAIRVETPSTALAILHMENGAVISFGASWDVWRHSHPPIELHGTEGSIRVPDPNFFGGIIEVSERGQKWRKTDCGDLALGAPNWPADKPKHANYRGLGVADLASSILHGTPHRTSAEAGQHVVDVMNAILESGRTGQFINLPASTRPAALGENEARRLT